MRVRLHRWTENKLDVRRFLFPDICRSPTIQSRDLFVGSLLAGEPWLRGGTDMCEMSLSGPAAART